MVNSGQKIRKIWLASWIIGATNAAANQLPDFNAEYNDYCEYPTTESENLCESSESIASDAFIAPPLLRDSIQVDLRPENCQSFFDDYLHTRRGLRIESALRTIPPFSHYYSTTYTFPVVDFYSNALYEQIIKDAAETNERLNLFTDNGQLLATSSTGQSTTLSRNDVKAVSIDIVIQTGLATSAHAKQIRKAAIELKRRWGYSLQLIEIP